MAPRGKLLSFKSTKKAVAFINAQAFTIAAMQSLRENGLSKELDLMASDAIAIASQSLQNLVESQPELEKVVDSAFQKIVTVRGKDE